MHRVSKTIALVTLLAFVSSSALAMTNGTSKGNQPKPSPAVGGPAAPRTAPAVGGPNNPSAGHVASPATTSTVGGPSAPAAPKPVPVAPAKPAASTAGPNSKPGSAAPPQTGKANGGKAPQTWTINLQAAADRDDAVTGATRATS